MAEGREVTSLGKSWWSLGLQNGKNGAGERGQLVITEDFTVVQYMYVQNVYSL